jgi:hypothetical protein
MSLLKVAVVGAVCGIICFVCIVCNVKKEHTITEQDKVIAQIYKY